tara:strand:+ start:1332 stop:1901 length:570 start_codon:yes stop_codon:yes gene_type:complete
MIDVTKYSQFYMFTSDLFKQVRSKMDTCFEVKTSKIHGLGLFCKRHVKKNSIFYIETSRPRSQAINFKENTYLLDYYIEDSCFNEGECIVGNKITRYKDIWASLDPSVFKKKYVTSNDIAMWCNDKVWPVKNEFEYNERKDTINNLEMLLVLSDGQMKTITGVAIRVLQNIYGGEECGNTYGYNFWVEE